MATPTKIIPSPEILQHAGWLAHDWLIHGFSTRIGGYSTAYSACGELNLGYTDTDDREAVRSNRELLVSAMMGKLPPFTEALPLATIRQMHTADIHLVPGSTPAGSAAMTGDGLLTADAGILLGILTADCVPVLVADTRLRVVGAFHAGWRGTVQRIVEKGVAKMVETFNSQADDLEAVIGPAIGACCYIVGAEVQDRFLAEFRYAADLTAPVQASSEANATSVRLDLKEANRRQLLAARLSEKSIYLVGGCTSCEPERYFSHRRSNGHTGRMMSIIGLRDGESR